MTAAAPAAARAAAAEFLRLEGGCAGVGEALALSVSEAVTNAVVHSGSERPIELGMSRRGTELEVRVRDHGRGMGPRSAARPGIGLGLPLMARLADAFALRDSEGGGLEVRLTFRCG